MKRLLILFFLTVALAGAAFAGPDRSATVDPSYPNYGNKWGGVAVATSSNTWVLISSAAVNSGKGIANWRFREIINCSDAPLMLAPNGTDFSTFSSTKAVVLSSGTAFQGDSWQVPGDGDVWGLEGSQFGTGGACGSEHWYK